MKYYDILGVDRDASQEEIKRAYREKVKETHPDQSDHPNAGQLFMQVKEAYDVLGDPDRKNRYDKHGISGTSSDGGATQSTTSADADGVGWRAHTRGTDRSESLWEGVQRQSDKPPGVDDIGGSRVTVVAGNVVAAFTGVLLGLEIVIYSVARLQGEQVGLIFSGSIGVLGVVLFALIFFVVIAGIEHLLGTHRTILSSYPNT
ncbi:J domain-containing protein [Natrarchaeobius chitinivorans]|uniref:J domain-containing protein n=1 Tax=Natrarchaeobius chitinivorans TaxID=1679083 RepID=UPI001404A686|nr:J domain-containing protein [Natrarchaeobius chitinivorans]